MDPNVPQAPIAKVDQSVAVNVIVFDAVSVLPSAIVNVAPVAGVVSVILFMLVAVATHSTGVINVGVLSLTTLPVPVLSVAATPFMENELPVPAVSYVLFVNVFVESSVT